MGLLGNTSNGWGFFPLFKASTFLFSISNCLMLSQLQA
jgi:hypothetical protein